MKDYFMKECKIRFISHIDGDCVNDRDGIKIDNGVRISVSVSAPTEASMYLKMLCMV